MSSSRARDSPSGAAPVFSIWARIVAVLSLLSCTFGSSKGSIPSTAPAIAVATSQR